MSPQPLLQKHIALGVTGSIAAYKAADLASKLTQSGALVDAILTPAATHFISPLTFQSVTGRQAYTENDLWGEKAHVLHIGLAHRAGLLIIAPASANTIAKLANGIADNLLSLTALAFSPGDQTRPLLIAPAMDGGMYSHPATQGNLRVLQERGAIIIGPETGHLASGLIAKGRMTEPHDLLGHIRYLLTRQGPLQGRKLVVTAGGTQEPLDPVRLLTNRSSGKQGYSLAQAALDVGAEVVLITTPVSLPVPAGAQTVRVETASQMETAVLQACQEADALLMAAAVADFRPAQIALQKMKKRAGTPTLTLEPTTDILAAVAEQRRQSGQPRIIVGFAAETEDLMANAQAKLRAKKLDMIVANDVSAPDAGFEVDTNRVALLKPDRQVEALPLMDKADVAEKIIHEVIAMFE